ncbi:MAG: hypothetical protein AABZ74_11105 [Cyanobacteriota bacterium]
MKVVLVYKQIFYSSYSALEVELTKNGIFFSIANCIGKNENGNFTYDWKQKNISKISISELCHLLEGLRAFRISKTEYEEKALKLNNGKYKNYQFPHKNKKGDARIGWQLYENKIQYIIKNEKNSTYTVQNMDISKIEHFLEYIINMSFSYDAIQDAQYSLDKELDIYEDE